MSEYGSDILNSPNCRAKLRDLNITQEDFMQEFHEYAIRYYNHYKIYTRKLLNRSSRLFLIFTIQTIGEQNFLLIYVYIPQRQTCIQRLLDVHLLRNSDDIIQVIKGSIYPIYNKVIGYTILGNKHFKINDHLPYVDIIMKLEYAFYSDIINIPSLRLNELYTHLKNKWGKKEPKYFKGDKLFIIPFTDYIIEALEYPDDEFMNRWNNENRSTIRVIKQMSEEYCRILDFNQLQYFMGNITNIQSILPNKDFQECHLVLNQDFSAIETLCYKNPWIPFGVRLMPLCNVEHLFSSVMSEGDRELYTFVKFNMEHNTCNCTFLPWGCR
ncbi:unnamed protein product [Dimorphilus gyrociliatus]|uniref:Uncharacterized protein n=1 Tax=Dimorphilus gyrociliatus TaxID=2664684 RepID=A0A7I8VJM1_9ANNE|nr:unnamed protein product [Dimorphilus gyrociliatus]